MMNLSIIVAMNHSRIIGVGDKIPWHIPTDLSFFKKTTMGHPMIMGRRTFESLPGVLPGRKHIVISTNRAYKAPEGVVIVHTLEDAIAATQGEKAFIIGGGTVYEQTIDLVDTMYITKVSRHVHTLHEDVLVKFPLFDRDHWSEEELKYSPKIGRVPTYSIRKLNRIKRPLAV